MKTLKAGDLIATKWWVGKRVICTRCAHDMELEDGDETLPCFTQTMPALVMVKCPTCEEPLSLYRLSNEPKAP